MGTRFLGESMEIVIETERGGVGRNNPPAEPTTRANVPIIVGLHIPGFPVQRTAKKRVGNISRDTIRVVIFESEEQWKCSDCPVFRRTNFKTVNFPRTASTQKNVSVLIDVVVVDVFKAEFDGMTDVGTELAYGGRWTVRILIELHLVGRVVVLTPIHSTRCFDHVNWGKIGIVREIEIGIKIDSRSPDGCLDGSRAWRRGRSLQPGRLFETIGIGPDAFGTNRRIDQDRNWIWAGIGKTETPGRYWWVHSQN